MKKNLKNILFIILLIVAIIIIWLIFSNDTKYGKKEYPVNGVSLSLKEETLASYTGATFILKNDSNIDMIYGSAYTIEVKKDGEWQELKTDMQFNDMGYNLKAKTSKEITINWENIYGKLECGKYRLIKKISYKNEQGYYVDFSINAEFILYDD